MSLISFVSNITRSCGNTVLIWQEVFQWVCVQDIFDSNNNINIGSLVEATVVHGLFSFFNLGDLYYLRYKKINNNNNNQWQCLWCCPHDHSHCESSPGSFDEWRLSARWPPALRPSQPTWAVSPLINGCYHPHPPIVKGWLKIVFPYNMTELIYKECLTTTKKLQPNLYSVELWTFWWNLEWLHRCGAGILKNVHCFGHPVYRTYSAVHLFHTC